MPKKFLAVREAIKDCTSPVMVFLSKGEVASQKTNLKAFSNGDFSIVSNLDKLFSPIDGGNLPIIEKSSQTVEGDTFQQFDSLVTMKCSECEALAGVDPDLAFAIASEEMHCPSCGKETAYSYDESEVADDDSDDDDDEVNVEVNVDTDDGDEDSSDDDEGGDEEEFDDVEDTDDSSEDESESEEASAVVEESTSETAEEVIEAVNPVDAAPAVTEQIETPVLEQPNDQVEQELHAADMADENASVKLVTLTNDNSEIAVFVGATHVGTMRRTMASETAAPLFENGQRLVAAFKPVFNSNRNNQTSSELAAYGYKPVTFKVHTGQLFEKRLEKEVAKVKTDSEAEVAARINNMSELMELAFVGINKGFFDGKNDLAGEIASLLERNGIANPEREARQLLARHSHNYIKSGVEKAKELSSQSPDYLRGITETIAKSDFLGIDTKAKEAASVSTSMLNPGQTRSREVASDFIGDTKRIPNKNRFADVVSGLGRR